MIFAFLPGTHQFNLGGTRTERKRFAAAKSAFANFTSGACGLNFAGESFKLKQLRSKGFRKAESDFSFLCSARRFHSVPAMPKLLNCIAIMISVQTENWG